MLVLEKSDFALPTIMDQKLRNYLSMYPFQQIQTYIFAFGMKNTSIYFDKKDKCKFDTEIAAFLPVAQSRNHPIIFIGYYKDKAERKRVAKCLNKWYGNLPIILMKQNNPGLVLELVSRMYQSKIAYTDIKASNIVNVSQYVPPTDLLVLHYVAHSKKPRMGYNSISSLYLYI